MKTQVMFINDTCPNYTIKWGDGKVNTYEAPNTCRQTNVTKKLTHTYAKAGSYIVRITYNAKGYSKTVTVPKDITKVTSFGLADVASVSIKQADPIPAAVDDEYTLYTITLKTGKVVEVKNYGNALASMNEKAFRDAGYTGDIAALKKMATAPVVTPFALTDVKSVVVTNADPIPAAVDDEYTLYTITLKTGKVVEVKNYGNALASMNEKAFRDAGYTGDIATLKKMATTTPVATTFALTEVLSVTMKNVDPVPVAVDDEYTLYTITLKSKKVVEVKNYGNALASMNEKAFRDAGYTGDIVALKKMATAPVTTTFALTDVKSITSKYVDPSPLMADEEYTLYAITLKSGKVVEVKAYAFAPVDARNKAFKDAGYTGDIVALLKLVVVLPSPISVSNSASSTGVVRGASTTNLKAQLDELLLQALKLQAEAAAL